MPEPPTEPENPVVPKPRETPPESPVRRKLRTRRQGERLLTQLQNPKFAVLYGILASNGVAFALLGLIWLLLGASGGAGGLYLLSTFVALPLLMGGICAYFWQYARLSRAASMLYGLLNVFIALAVCYLFLREGIVCLFMASPLVLIFLFLGIFLGKKVFQQRHKTLQLSVAPLLLLLIVVDALTPHHFQNQETDRLVIHASPQQVWRYIIDYPSITAPSNYWLCHLGLPAPVQSTASGHYIGAQRRCVFTNQIAFEEKITELIPARQLTFAIVTQPNDPEVIGHLTLKRGRFTLIDNHDGTTTVIGTSWYALNVYPSCYFDWWTQDVIRGVHLRVMRHIQTLAEADAKKERR